VFEVIIKLVSKLMAQFNLLINTDQNWSTSNKDVIAEGEDSVLDLFVVVQVPNLVATQLWKFNAVKRLVNLKNPNANFGF
jgi:hypothetical protein